MLTTQILQTMFNWLRPGDAPIPEWTVTSLVQEMAWWPRHCMNEFLLRLLSVDQSGKYFTPIVTNTFHLTHWGIVTHICVGKLTIIGSDNGLSPGRRQAIIWTNARVLLIWTLGTNFSEILSETHIFSFKEMYLKMSSVKWRQFCLGLNGREMSAVS